MIRRPPTPWPAVLVEDGGEVRAYGPVARVAVTCDHTGVSRVLRGDHVAISASDARKLVAGLREQGRDVIDVVPGEQVDVFRGRSAVGALVHDVKVPAQVVDAAVTALRSAGAHVRVIDHD